MRALERIRGVSSEHTGRNALFELFYHTCERISLKRLPEQISRREARDGRSSAINADRRNNRNDQQAKTNNGCGGWKASDAVAREQSKPLIPEHEADVGDSRRAGYRWLAPPRRASAHRAILSRRYFLPIREGETL